MPGKKSGSKSQPIHSYFFSSCRTREKITPHLLCGIHNKAVDNSSLRLSATAKECYALPPEVGIFLLNRRFVRALRG